MLKKKYRKMYGQNPPKWMKERLIKTMVSPSEYRDQSYRDKNKFYEGNIYSG